MQNLKSVEKERNAKLVHDLREGLFADGMCKKVTIESKRCKYPVSKFGKAYGYSNNKNGNIKVGHLKAEKISKDFTMTSLELSELMNERHDTVLQNIRKICLELPILKCEEREYIDGRGESNPMLILDVYGVCYYFGSFENSNNSQIMEKLNARFTMAN